MAVANGKTISVLSQRGSRFRYPFLGWQLLKHARLELAAAQHVVVEQDHRLGIAGAGRRGQPSKPGTWRDKEESKKGAMASCGRGTR